jgi:hypothetical protein
LEDQGKGKVQIRLQVNKLVLGKTMWDEKDCGLTTVLAVQCQTHPTEIARIAGLMKQNVPFYIIVGTDQAEMDLDTHNIIFRKLDPNQPPLPLENGARMAENQATIAEKEQDEAGKTAALEEAAAIVAGADPLTGVQSEITAAEGNHNGHDKAEALENTLDSASFVDLSTFDQRPANGIAVPHAFFLLGQRIDCTDISLKQGLLKLFGTFNVVYNTPEELTALLEKYPESDSRTIILEILRAPDLDKQFDAIQSAGEEYRKEKALAAAGDGTEAPKSKKRSKKTDVTAGGASSEQSSSPENKD